jgi:ketosteroid isomerase-like protein
MSQENVEIVRRYFAELPEAAELLATMAAEFWESNGDYYPVRKFPEARPCHGREEIARFLADYRAAWERYRYVIKDARAIGDDRVLVHAHISAEGRTSGVALEGDLYHCCWLRHGRFIRVEDHLTAKGALHALGLSGEALEAAGLRE